MAKDNKKTISLMDVNEDNFSESLKSVNSFGEDIVKAAAEKEEADNKERKIREYNSIKDKAVYLNLSLVARSKYSKKCNDIMTEARNQSKALLERVTKGELSANEYDEELKKVIDDQVKEVGDRNVARGVETWQANFEITPLGVELKRYFPIDIE